MYYCVRSLYRVGWKVTRDVYPVSCADKPMDNFIEYPLEVVAKRYFDTEEEANHYYSILTQRIPFAGQ